MRNLILCTDGTWNSPDQMDRGRQVPSNVVKMARAVETSEAKAEIEQLVYYDTGVGTKGAFDKLLGGATGKGMTKNIREAYTWLAQHYQTDDRLFLFGFSRGAFTARSVCGVVGVCGIPTVANLDEEAAAKIAQEAIEIYRVTDPEKRNKLAAEFRDKNEILDESSDIHFIGVWDTVGALGIPTDGPINWWIRRKYKFHDVRLSDRVKFAYHALAINERRGPFAPTLWKVDESAAALAAKGRVVEQVWFPGVHSNVGGGYADTGLSDRTLIWMIEKASAAGLDIEGIEIEGPGLKPDAEYLEKRIDPNWYGELRKSMSWKYKIPIIQSPKAREIGVISPKTEAIHFSARERWKRYRRPDDPPQNYIEALTRGVPLAK